MTKMSGAEWLEFYHDNSIWDTGAFHEDERLSKNGELIDADDKVLPTDKIELSGGTFYPTAEYENGRSLEAVIKKWRKSKTHDTWVVQIPKEKQDEFNAMLKNIGGTRI